MRFFRRKRGRKVPICIFCYHKVGTMLTGKVFGELCEAKRWKFHTLLGKQTKLPRRAGVVLFAHSLIDPRQLGTPYTGIHMIRDPRDVIVSGYLYHRRTAEKWCVNSNHVFKAPIGFPQVPYSQQHRSEDWKIRYLKSLDGKSYQQNLLSRSQHDGLLFEMDHYGLWTIESMKQWQGDKGRILELRFEDLMDRYDETFRRIFAHLGFRGSELELCMEIASRHDLGRKSEREIEEIAHVHSKQTNRWKDYFEPGLKEAFIEKFGDVLIDLGYEKDHSW